MIIERMNEQTAKQAELSQQIQNQFLVQKLNNLQLLKQWHVEIGYCATQLIVVETTVDDY